MRKPIYFYCLLIAYSLPLSAQTPCESLYGVWKYETEGLEGMNILTLGHYIWVLNEKARPYFHDKPSFQEKAEAFDKMTISAGTWTCDGNRATVTQQFAKDPNEIGTRFSFDFDIIGDKGDYWVINPEGERSPKGVARRVAEWKEESPCSKLNGVWEYENLKGLYIQSGVYGAWVVADPDQAQLASDLKTMPGKARAFQAIEGYYALSDCKGDHRCHWTILHSSNPAMEKQILYTELQVRKNSFSGRYIDTDRRLVGEEWQMRRLE